MPDKVGERAIDRAIASVRRGGTLDLGFFGGEPLLEFDLIRKAVAFVRSRPSGDRALKDESASPPALSRGSAATEGNREAARSVRFQLPTNGTCFTRKILDFLVKNPDIEVSVSRIRHPGELRALPNLVVNVCVFPKRAGALPGYTAWLLDSGFRRINILPEYFCRWNHSELKALSRSLEIVAGLFGRYEDASLENLVRFGPVPLFNSGWTVDTTGVIYCSNMFLAKPFEKAGRNLRIGHVSDGCVPEPGALGNPGLKRIMKRRLSSAVMDSTTRVDSILSDFVRKMRTQCNG